MVRRVKTRMECHILTSLYESIGDYGESIGLKPSQIFNQHGMQLVLNPKPLPIRSHRRITIFHKRAQYEAEFPMKRVVLYVEAVILQKLFNIYDPMSRIQFNEKRNLDQSTIANTVFYYYAITHDLPFGQRYFDEEYFNHHYTFNEHNSLEAFISMLKDKGKAPTQKEWQLWRKEYDGPSETWIIKTFGTFSNFKHRALDIYQRKLGKEE